MVALMFYCAALYVMFLKRIIKFKLLIPIKILLIFELVKINYKSQRTLKKYYIITQKKIMTEVKQAKERSLIGKMTMLQEEYLLKERLIEKLIKNHLKLKGYRGN